jgi:hypothetical protein
MNLLPRRVSAWLRHSLSGPSSGRRPRRLTGPELLEDRVTPANLNIDAVGTASFVANLGELNDVTLSLAGALYTFTDNGAPITVSGAGAGPLAANAQGAGTNTVTVLASFLASISIDTGDLADFVNIKSTGVPTTVTTSGTGDDNDTVTIGNAGTVQGITAMVNVANVNALSRLIIDDSADTTGRTVTINDTTVHGLAPANITFDATAIGDVGGAPGLTINGGSGGNHFTINNSIAAATTTLNMGAGNDAVTVLFNAAGSTLNFNGQAGNDTFEIVPSSNATINVDGGTGTNNLDYIGAGMVNPSGTNAGTITQATANPVTFSNSQNVALAPGGVFELSAVATVLFENAGPWVLTVSRIGSSTGTISVQVTTMDGTAVAGADYTSVNTTLNFGDGVTGQTVNVPLLNDGQPDPRETFSIGISNPSNGAALGSNTTISLLEKSPNGNANQRYVAQVYQDLLLREADPAGLAFWSGVLDSGGTAARPLVSKSLAHSAEYYATNIVKPAYLQFLGRPGDPAGINFWVSQLQHGMTDEQVQAGFIASPEFFAQSGSTNMGYLDNLYLKLLMRPADPVGEGFWLEFLNANHGTRQDVALAFTTSPEGFGVRVLATYQRYLGRGASAPEIAFWVNLLKAGSTDEDIVTGFIGSNEYFMNANS